MAQVVFHGINGVGLGHIARLSVIQRYLAAELPELSMEALCRSERGPDFFSCPCTNVPRRRDLMDALGIRGLSGYRNLLQARTNPEKRKTVMFDTYWSDTVVKKLKTGGHRTVLVMQSFKPDYMLNVARFAQHYFDHVWFPFQAEELEFHYREHAALWNLLQQDKFEALGPFVREALARDDSEKVIFTLGGGGEHDDEDPKYSVRSYLEEYVRAARVLDAAGKKNLYIAKGPLMSLDVDLGPLKTLETMQLPDHFGPKTTVITRGTYNLTWEAIAAGAKLVTTERSAISDEYSDSRNRYLAEKKYAYRVPLDGEAMAKAILLDAPSGLSEATELINARKGLSRIAEILSE